MSDSDLTLAHYLSKYSEPFVPKFSEPYVSKRSAQRIDVHDHYLFSVNSLNEIEVVDLSSVSFSQYAPVKVLDYEHSLTSPIEHLSVNPNGNYLVLHTAETTLVLELTRLIIVNLNEERSNFRSSHVKVITCPSHVLAPSLHSHIQDFLILKFAWHPLSPDHLFILSNDNMLRIYNLKVCFREAEQVFCLSTYFSQVEKAECFVSFAFVESAECATWDAFSVYLISETGSVYLLCPIVPNGAFVERSCLEYLDQAAAKELEPLFPCSKQVEARIASLSKKRSWISSVLGESKRTDSLVRIQMIFNQNLVPDLQGPVHIITKSDDNSESQPPSYFKDIQFLHSSPPVALKTISPTEAHLIIFLSQCEPKWHSDSTPPNPISAILWQRLLFPSSTSHISLIKLNLAPATKTSSNTFYIYNSLGIFQLDLPWLAQLTTFLRDTSHHLPPSLSPSLISKIVHFRKPNTTLDSVLAVTNYFFNPSNPSSGLFIYLLRFLDSSQTPSHLCTFHYQSKTPLPSISLIQSPISLSNLPSPLSPPPTTLSLPHRPGPAPLLPPGTFSSPRTLDSTTNLKRFIDHYSNIKRVHILYLYDIYERLKNHLQSIQNRTETQLADLNHLSQLIQPQRLSQLTSRLHEAYTSQDVLYSRSLCLIDKIRSKKYRATSSELRWFEQLESLKQTVQEHQDSLNETAQITTQAIEARSELISLLSSVKLSPEHTSQLEALIDKEDKAISNIAINLKLLQLNVHSE